MTTLILRPKTAWQQRLYEPMCDQSKALLALVNSGSSKRRENFNKTDLNILKNDLGYTLSKWTDNQSPDIWG